MGEKIPDEAVQAALDEAGSAWGMHLSREGKESLMRQAFSAAMPFLMPRALVAHDMTEEDKERFVAGWRKASGDVIMSIVHEAMDGEDEIERLNKALGEKYAEIARLQAALKLAAVRMEILTGRMRGCHEETGKHELLDEAEEFCREARAALNGGAR